MTFVSIVGIKELDHAYVWICDMFDEIQRLRKIKSEKIRQRDSAQAGIRIKIPA